MRFNIKDIEKIIPLLREHQQDDNGHSFSERKVRKLLEREWENPKSLILVNKEFTAVLVLMVVPSSFSTKQLLQEVCFYSKTPGSGFRLLKEALPWIRSWGDGVMYKTFMSTGTEETNKMLERFGMKRLGVVYDMGEL